VHQLGKDLNPSDIDVYRTFTEKLSMRIHTHGEHPYISARETQGLMDIISRRPASRMNIRPEKSMAFQINLKSCPSLHRKGKLKKTGPTDSKHDTL